MRERLKTVLTISRIEKNYNLTWISKPEWTNIKFFFGYQFFPAHAPGLDCIGFSGREGWGACERLLFIGYCKLTCMTIGNCFLVTHCTRVRTCNRTFQTSTPAPMPTASCHSAPCWNSATSVPRCEVVEIVKKPKCVVIPVPTDYQKQLLQDSKGFRYFVNWKNAQGIAVLGHTFTLLRPE